MSYQVLARKWRPQTFAEIVGQEAVTTILTNSIAQDRVHHAFLFAGTRGVGKTTTARILAKSLNCSNRSGPEPCNECESCLEIAADNSMDVQEIDGASNRSIDDIKKLRESVRYSPSRDRNKIFIIDEVHQLTKDAFNALLKTLEEPPPRVVFIMATTEQQKLMATIISRCQVFEFKQIASSAIFTHLAKLCAAEGVTISERCLQLVTRVAAGSMRDALSTLDQVISFCGNEVTDEQVLHLLDVTDFDLLQQAASAIEAGDAAAVFSLVHRLQEKGHDLNRFCRDLVNHMRNLILVKLFGPDENLGDGSLATLTETERQELTVMADRFTEPNLVWCIDVLLKTDQEIRWASQPGFLLETALVKLAQQTHLKPLSELLRLLEGGPAPDSGGTAGGPKPRSADRPAPSRSPTTDRAGARKKDGEKPAGTVEGLLSALAGSKPSLHGMLALAAGVHFADGELLIEFAEKDRFQQEHIGRPDNLKTIKELARHQFGPKVSIRVEAVANPAMAPEPETLSAPGPLPEEPPNGRSEAAARAPDQPPVDDPLIQKALDLFGGEITSVETPDNAANSESPAQGGNPDHG
jgi:DNA polymerase-3 subunit gamma/tau